MSDAGPLVRALGRSGWRESGSIPLLRPVLARIGVLPLRRRLPLEVWAAAAAEARPRRPLATGALRH